MPKPNDFFVGVLDFFAILLPGGILVAILEPRIGEHVFGELISMPTSSSEKWVIFLILAYFLGHLIFMIGSYIDNFYNVLRSRLNPYSNESAYQCATQIKEEIIERSEQVALNTFQWARSVLILKYPAAANDIHRLEADSKFFRSLLVICVLSTLIFLYDAEYLAGLVAASVGVPCFMRYYERRLKSTTQAYIHIITIHRLDRKNKIGDVDDGKS